MRGGRLLSRDLSRSARRLAGVGVAVLASVAVLVVLGAVGLGIERHVIGPLLPRLPLEMLEVKPKTLSLGLVAFDAGDLSGGIDAALVDDLGRLEGVRAVHPVYGSRVPLRAEGGEGFLGRRLRTDVFATGVPLALVEGDVAPGESFADDPGGPVPVILARRFLDLYNSTVAPAIEKPRLSERLVIGFEFLLTVGQSFTGGRVGEVEQVRARVVGFSDRASMVGLTVPEPTLRRLHDRYDRETVITGLWVQVASPEAAGPVARRIEKRGLRVDDTPKLVGAALSVAAGLFGLFALLLLSLSGFAIAQAFSLMVAERRSELAILRALGARKLDLFALVLIEAAVVGAMGSIAGVLAGAGLALGLDRWVTSTLPDLPFQPEALVALDPGLLAGTLLLGVGAALLGALAPALRAARADPALALRS